MILRHRGQVAGWTLVTDLVMNSYGALQLRVNGENQGKPMMECTIAHGRRKYQAMLKRLERPRQMTLPI